MEKATHRALMVRAARSGGQWVQAGWGAAILSRVGLATQELMS